jgi:ATP-dependent helicase YprA (DUF1998 family)
MQIFFYIYKFKLTSSDRSPLHQKLLKSAASKDGKLFRFHYHQEQAFRRAQHQEPYVLTTGTGSGKSMTYVVPIIVFSKK